MSDFPIKRFQIRGLFGKKNVNLDFSNSINVYVGENGIGKTTILNCIYNTISGNFSRLLPIEFKDIIVSCVNKEYVLDRKDLKTFREHESLFELLGSSINHVAKNEQERISEVLFSRLLSNNDNAKRKKKEKEFDEFIKTMKEYNVLYFPTYRRVEEDFSKITDCKKDKSFYEFIENLSGDSSSLIQFGMHDVENLLDKILSEIKKTLLIGFTELTQELLHSKTINDRLQALNEDYQYITAILGNVKRLGVNIERDINDIIVSNLQDILKERKKYEEQIERFIETCNNYFADKKFVYDKSNITYKIILNDESIKLSQLSSGEKQIVSLFSKIFLDRKKKIILFDEPELSLSIYWQRKLLIDVKNSKNCDFLLSVTHSPFIFDNELKDYAKSLSESIK